VDRPPAPTPRPQTDHARITVELAEPLPDAGPYPKDLAYNKGFIQVHNFLGAAIAQGKVYRIGLLFTGKTALERIACSHARTGKGCSLRPGTRHNTSSTWPDSAPGSPTHASSTSSTSTGSKPTTPSCCDAGDEPAVGPEAPEQVVNRLVTATERLSPGRDDAGGEAPPRRSRTPQDPSARVRSRSASVPGGNRRPALRGSTMPSVTDATRGANAALPGGLPFWSSPATP
jgi:hypothetical protein